MSTRRPNLCVIPAKARSTRLPGKNVALLGGQPLVARTVETAISSAVFDIVMVSTDDEQIAQISRDAGASIPFMRDPELAEDRVEVPAVVSNVVQWYYDHKAMVFDWVCILQPTSPMRTTVDIIASRDLLTSCKDADGLMSITKYHYHPYWALQLQDGVITPVHPAHASTSRQDLPDMYHPDGTIIWRRAQHLLDGQGWYEGKILAYLTPGSSRLDIDDPQDLQYARWMIERPPC